MTTMTTTTTMMNQAEEEEESTAPLLAAAADGRSCSMCGVMKKKVDYPFSLLRKIQTECRACLLFRSSGSIETHEESAAVTFANQYHYQHQQKPHFVLIHGAEIV
jgi:hypothetical protein